jgi:putative acetyltransferase
MRVRDATPADAMPVFALHVAASRRLPRTEYTDEQVRDWADKRGEGPERYETDDLLVAERNGFVVGFGEWDHADETGVDTAELVACYVHPDHARSGVGTALVERMHDEMRAAGFERAELTASLNAVGFYDRRGYDRVERFDLEPADVAFPVVRMARDL